MPTPAELRDWDRRHFWHAFTQMAEYEPLVIERAEGCWLVDVDGRRYLDGVSSLWCNLHGHRHPRIDAAIVEQLGKLAHATTLGMSNPPAIELARRLAELAPGDLNHVFFSSDGSSRRRSGAQDRLPILAAVRRAAAGEDERTSPSTAPTTATRWAARPSAASSGFTPCSSRCCSTSCGCRRPTAAHGDAATHLARLEAVLAERHERDRRGRDRAARARRRGHDHAAAGLPARRPRAHAASTTCC